MDSCPVVRHSTGGDEFEGTPSTRRAKRSRADADESDDATTYGKMRVRVTRACNECRRRKDRCDGMRPSCRPCLNIGRTCSYNPSKKRGLRTGYVRALEILLGMIFSTIDGSESWILSLIEGKGRQPSFRIRDAAHTTGADADTTEVLVDAWRKGEVSKQVEQWLSIVESAEGSEDGDSTKIFDSKISQAMALAARVLSGQGPLVGGAFHINLPNTNTNTIPPIQPPNRPAPSSLLSAPQPDTRLIVADHVAPTAEVYCPDDGMAMYSEETLKANKKPRLPDNWSHLFDLYFATTHSWLPIFQKHELLRLAYMLQNDSGNSDMPEAMTKGELALIWAVMAYSLRQSECEKSKEFSEFYQVKARSLLSADLEQFELGHVRALLVLALLQLDCGNRVAAWLSVGRATYAAISFLLLPDAQVSMRVQIDEGTRRTLVCCFVMDTLAASWVKSRPYFKRADIASIDMLPTDSMEEWEPWQSKDGQGRAVIPQRTPGHILSIFNRFLQLVVFLNDLLRLRNKDRQIERLQEVSRALRTWKQQNVPQSQAFCEDEMSPQKLNFQLAYISVFEALRTEELRLTGTQTESATAIGDGRMHMHEQGQALDHHFRNMGVSSIPPTSTIYLSCFDRSLDYQIRLQAHPSIKEDLQALRTSFLELDSALLRARNALNKTQHSNPAVATTPAGAAEGSGMNPRPSIQPPRSEVQLNPATPISSGLPALSRPSSLSQHLTFDQLMGATAGDMDDNELFQSLADLDSADWSANPPEFMEHLGVVRDVTTDLQSFFDKEPE